MTNKNQCLFILCGEAFSGKSTLSEKLSELYSAKVIGRDKIYFAIDGTLALEDTPEDDEDNVWINLWPLALQGVKNQLLLGNSVVFDDNCLRFHQREEVRLIAKNIGVRCILIYLHTSAETIRARKEQNKITKIRHDVPSGWIEEEAQLFERPVENESPIVYTESDKPNKIFEKIDSILFGY